MCARGSCCVCLVRLHDVRGCCVCIAVVVLSVVMVCGLLRSFLGGRAVVVSLSLVVVGDCVGCSVGVSVRLCVSCVQKISSSLVNIVIGSLGASVLSVCC